MKYREYVLESAHEHAERPLRDWRDVEQTVEALGAAGLLSHPLDQEGYVEQIRTIGADRPVRTLWVPSPIEPEGAA